jgi:Flp pilus assembly protein TadG
VNSLIRMRGTTSVEFAIAALVTLIILFAVIEFGRLLFVRAMLEEGARRGARLAAVCPIGDGYVSAASRFANEEGGSRFIPDLTPENVVVQYLDAAGNALGTPANDPASIRYVRVSIEGYSMPLFIPLFEITLNPASVSSIQPVESLGLTATGAVAC